MKKFSCAAILFLIISATNLFAQIPHTLSFQGVLTDTTGHLKPDGAYNFTFRIYSNSSGGSALWSESKSLNVNHGLFSTLLGDITPIGLSFDTPYWLSIQIASDPELSPRIRLSSSGYSFRSIKSDTALYSMSSARQNFADSSRIAGTIPDGSVTRNKVSAKQLVKSLNGLTDSIVISTTGGATLTTDGNIITINAGSGNGSSNIQTIQNSNNTLDVTNPNGPTTTINVKDKGIGTAQLADSSVTSTKISANQVVKKINGLSDNITLSATGGATITSNGSTITINAGSGGTGTGIQGVQNTDNTLDITNSNGPTATINVKSQGISTTQIADGSITQTKIANGVTLPPGGTAGGDLTGTYPNPTVGNSTIDTLKLANNSVTSSKIVDATIQSSDLAGGSVTQTKIANGVTLPPNGNAGGDLTGSYPNPTITNNAINTTKIIDNAITTSKLVDGSVTLAKLNSTGATTGMVLKYNGTNITWADDNIGGLTFPYSASTSSSSPLFFITNAGTGSAGFFSMTNSSSTGNSLTGITYGSGAGIYGGSGNNNGTGVLGTSPAGTGVFGTSTSGFGLSGLSSTSYGLYATSQTNTAVYGYSSSGTAVVGFTSTGPIAVNGICNSDTGTGVYGTGVDFGVYGVSDHYVGVEGYSSSFSGVIGAGDSKYGVYGFTTYGFGSYSSGPMAGVWSHNNEVGNDVHLSTPNYAAEMNGNVDIVGNLTKSSGSFKIDHPLDPANKYLYHSFVESPDMKNIYDGVVTLDASGQATVTLPDWFEALNKDFRYQLTAIGVPGPNLYISKEISGNNFSITGGQPGMKVSWQVTGIRHDAWADANRIPVEKDKSPQERGYYIHPGLFGQPQNKMVQYALHPEIQQQQSEIQKIQNENQKMQIERQKIKAENQKMQEKINLLNNKVK